MKTYLNRASQFEVYHHFSGLSFIAEVNFWRPAKNRRFLRFIHSNNDKNKHFHHHQLLQTGFSMFTEALATSLRQLDSILPEICALSLVLAVLCGLK